MIPNANMRGNIWRRKRTYSVAPPVHTARLMKMEITYTHSKVISFNKNALRQNERERWRATEVPEEQRGKETEGKKPLQTASIKYNPYDARGRREGKRNGQPTNNVYIVIEREIGEGGHGPRSKTSHNRSSRRIIPRDRTHLEVVRRIKDVARLTGTTDHSRLRTAPAERKPQIHAIRGSPIPRPLWKWMITSIASRGES